MRAVDPQAVGEWLLAQRAIPSFANEVMPFHKVADLIPWLVLPEIDKNASMGTETVKEYRRELEERAAAGDKYAASMLRGEAYHEPGDERE